MEILIMKKIVNVTQKDVNLGVPKSCVNCPISLAIKRLFKSAGCQVYSEKVLIFTNGRVDTFILPREAQEFIIEFDQFKLVKPFRFTLSV
jgi:hypothetical protein